METTIKKQLVEIAKTFSPQKILVVGDIMLDQYIWGKVERISPEAPIPVLRVEKEEFRLGGAANVASNLKALNCEPVLAGIAGADIGGKRIIELMEKLEISARGIVFHESFQTIVKQRALTSEQHLLRIDYESSSPADSSLWEASLLDKIKVEISGVDGVIISDYAKGALSESLIQLIISMAGESGLPVVGDPGKGVDFSRYRGITALKPNRSELEQAGGIKVEDRKSTLEAAAALKEKCRPEFLAISLDKDGVLLFRGPGDFRFIETESKEVYDVTGAGDIVVSVIGALLAGGVSPELAIYMANVAAGIEIARMGVVSVKWPEILERLDAAALDKKVVAPEEARDYLEQSEGEPAVFTNGYFDNISAGHLRFLVEAGKIPGRLIAAVNSDRSIIRQKGSPPLLKELDRARLLASLENICRVVIFDEEDASGLIRLLKPKIIVKGEDFKNQKLPEQQAIEEVGAEVRYIRRFSWNENSKNK